MHPGKSPFKTSRLRSYWSSIMTAVYHNYSHWCSHRSSLQLPDSRDASQRKGGTGSLPGIRGSQKDCDRGGRGRENGEASPDQGQAEDRRPARAARKGSSSGELVLKQVAAMYRNSESCAVYIDAINQTYVGQTIKTNKADTQIEGKAHKKLRWCLRTKLVSIGELTTIQHTKYSGVVI